MIDGLVSLEADGGAGGHSVCGGLGSCVGLVALHRSACNISHWCLTVVVVCHSDVLPIRRDGGPDD